MNTKNNIDFKPIRVEALSDGVFAIVMTLLVIDLSVPMTSKPEAASELGAMLLEMWPKFFAFILSFIVLGVFWFSHYGLFRFINRSNSKFAWINIFFLMTVSLIPFSTKLIGEYYIYSKIAVIFYGSNGLLAMLIIYILWWYATNNNRLINNRTKPLRIKRIKVGIIIICSIFLLAIILSFVSPLISIAIYISAALYGIIGQLVLRQELIKNKK